ncbi:hypothetical protein AAHB37_07075 [Glutamicibacter halophytocola]|uniref:hypothetical protein n=1 Tax=Glutamicibacter halophytocola TaxID=1933880 RepID=UPI00321B97CC
MQVIALGQRTGQGRGGSERSVGQDAGDRSDPVQQAVGGRGDRGDDRPQADQQQEQHGEGQFAEAALGTQGRGHDRQILADQDRHHRGGDGRHDGNRQHQWLKPPDQRPAHQPDNRQDRRNRDEAGEHQRRAQDLLRNAEVHKARRLQGQVNAGEQRRNDGPAKHRQ